jgi:hypothetical protein
VTFDVLKLLEQEGYIKDGEDNLVHAEKAFFAARVMQWIRNKVKAEPDFNLTAYLTMLMYYKTDMADLKFTEDGSKLVYRMKNNDKEVQVLVDSLVKSSNKSHQKPSTEEGEAGDAQSPDRDSES